MKLLYKVHESVTLRQWIRHHFPCITYERLQQSLRKRDIKVNNAQVTPQHILHPSDSVMIWDKLTIDDRANVKITPKFWEKIKLIDQNEWFWVIDKPYGIPSQKGNNIKVSLVEILESWMGKRPYIVHRLDRCTTGLMVIAACSYSARDLSASLKEGLWHKEYIAQVEGKVSQRSGIMDYPVSGKPAMTKYEVIGTENDYSILRLTPITGRKHQIRQHCARFVYPIVGDERYGSISRCKMQLRCTYLAFEFRGKTFKYALR